MFNLCVPLKKFKVKQKLTWFNDEIQHAINNRDLANCIWRRVRSIEAWENFRQKSNQVTHLIRSAKNQFLESYCDPNLPPNIFWNHIKSLGVGKSKQSHQSIPFFAQEINDHFCSLGNTQINSVPKFEIPDSDFGDNSFTFMTVTQEDVSRAIFAIKSDAIGLDEIHLKFLKIVLPSYIEVITHLFNFCIENCVFPDIWKIAKIIPLAKVKTPSGLKDLRPISILSCLSKAFEIILKTQIMDYLNDKNLINKFQSGFRTNHSTTTAMLNICDDIKRNIDDKAGTILVLLDFSSAFTSVNHDILLRKLYQFFNFSCSSLNLINTYLRDRLQAVYVNNEKSQFNVIDSGVPQGSVLGPIFFLMFINDITNNIKFSKCHIFADDLQLYIEALLNDVKTAIERMNADLQNILLWSQRNCISLNPAKSQSIFIYNKSIDTSTFPPVLVNRNVIPYFDKVKDLGLILNKQLTWDDHLSYMAQKIYGSLRSLWNVTKFASPGLKKKLIISFIFPIFIYCDVVFYGMSKGYERKLQIMFNACVRYVYNLRKFDHVSNFSNSILNCDLITYYKIRVLIQFFKIIVTHSPDYLYEKISFAHSSRNKNLLIPLNRSNHFNSSFFVKDSMLWNQLPTHIKNSESIRNFKCNCIEYFDNL